MTALAPSIASHVTPLSDADFEGLMQAFGPLPKNLEAAVAISGGPDSTALAFLLNRWLQKRGGTLLALTIDHRLRDASGLEAADLGHRLAAQNIDHVILPWRHHTAPESGIHASARRARYNLLLGACRANHIAHLFLGHHADDQAETLLMRLSRSTGIDGLAGMALMREQDGVKLMRPLLSTRKAQLEALCHAQDLEYVVDPSNDALRFTRARLRHMGEGLAQAGFTTEKLLTIAQQAGAARAQLEKACNHWLQNHAHLSFYGSACFPQAAYAHLESPMRLRLLSRILVSIGGAEYPPRGGSLERLAAQLAAAARFRQTLGGCGVELHDGIITLYREAGLIRDQLPVPAIAPYRRWDNRFVFSRLPRWESEGLVIRALHTASRKQLEKAGADSVAALPAAIRAGLPGIYLENELLGVPALISQPADLPQKALVTATFSPAMGILIKPFCAASPMLT